MKGKIKTISKRKQTRFAMLSLLILIALAGCAKEKAAVKSPDKIQGTLSIDGNNISLKHIYARRTEAIEDQKRPYIEILLASEKIPDETLTEIYSALADGGYLSDSALTGTSIKGLHIRIDKTQRYKDVEIGFYMDLLIPEDVIYTDADHKFEAFDLKRGAIKASAKNEWEQTDYGNMNSRKVKYSYAVTFETSLTSSNTAATELSSQPPAEGSADGMVQTKDEVIPLKYAYACREKMFFDEPEVQVKLLITSSPIPEKDRLKALNDLWDLDFESRPEGSVEIKIDQFGRMEYGYIRAKSDNLSTNRFTPKACLLEGDRIKGNFQKEINEKSSVDFSIKDFSATFDAPLKT
jgi:hypothetical protein